MSHLRSFFVPTVIGGLAVIGISGAALIMDKAPSLDEFFMRADPIAWAARDTSPSVTRIQLVGTKASKCNRSSGIASVRKLSCKTSGAGMKKRGNIVFAKPPR